MTPSESVRAIGYVRCSTADQADGYGLQAQRDQIIQHCQDRQLELVDTLADEGASGKNLDRPALLEALQRLVDGDADALVASKLDRLTRSVQDFARLLDWFLRQNRVLVVLDCEVDTGSPAGEAMAHVLATFAQFERRMISQRTRDGLRAGRLQGRQMGLPRVEDRPELADRIRGLRSEGLSLGAVCARLEAEGVPTVRGGARWRPSAVQGVLGYVRRPARPRALVLPEARR